MMYAPSTVEREFALCYNIYILNYAPQKALKYGKSAA